jgi:hypothetical protein
VKEKILQGKIKTVCILLNVNAMLYFKFELQLKFRNNKNYSSTIVNFHSGSRWKCISLKLKIGKTKTYNEKRTVHWYVVASLSLKYIKQCLTEVTSFRLSNSLYSRSVLFKYTNHFGSVVPNCLDRQDQISSHVRCLFSISSWLYYFNFSSTLRTFLVFVTVVTLPLYRSPVNCRSRNVEGNFKHRVKYCYYCHFPGLEFI